MRKLISIIVFVVLMNNLFSQNILESSATLKPEWLSEPPKGEAFIYYTGIGSSSESLEGALKSAMSNILSQLTFENNTTIQVSSSYNKEENSKIKFNGKEDVSFNENFMQVIKADGEKITIKGLKKEEEYWQKIKNNSGIEYQYWVLMKLPKKGAENKEVKQGYGFAPVWRSALVPGWGQLYKKEKTKGIVILSGTALLVLGAVISENQRSSYETLSLQAKDIKIRKDHMASADQWSIIRNGLLASVGCVYIYNIIDAITAKGAKKYAWNPDRNMNFYTVYLNNEFKAGLIYKF